MVPPLWKTDQQFLKRITELIRDPEKTLPRIIQRIKTYFHQKNVNTCSQQNYSFIAVLFKIIKGKRPKYPSTFEWVRKTWYIHTLEYQLSIK